MLRLNKPCANIELLKEELLSLAKKHGACSDIVIKKSQELDILILEEMKIRTQNAQNY